FRERNSPPPSSVSCPSILNPLTKKHRPRAGFLGRRRDPARLLCLPVAVLFRALVSLNKASTREIALQRPDLKLAPKIGFDAQRGRNGPRKSGVVWHFMQEGRAPQ